MREENRGRTRAEWFIYALRHADVHVLLSAIEELSRAMTDNFGYFAAAPHAARCAGRDSGEMARRARAQSEVGAVGLRAHERLREGHATRANVSCAFVSSTDAKALMAWRQQSRDRNEP